MKNKWRLNHLHPMLVKAREERRKLTPNDELMEQWEDLVKAAKLQGSVTVLKSTMLLLDTKLAEYENNEQTDTNRKETIPPPYPEPRKGISGRIEEIIRDSIPHYLNKGMTTFPCRQLDRDAFIERVVSSVVQWIHGATKEVLRVSKLSLKYEDIQRLSESMRVTNPCITETASLIEAERLLLMDRIMDVLDKWPEKVRE